MKSKLQFWSSVNLTGNQTVLAPLVHGHAFWSSVNLTGNQTEEVGIFLNLLFWSSVNLTGNQTHRAVKRAHARFGAVSI